MMLRTALYVFSFAIACGSCGKKTTNKNKSATATQSILPSNTGNLSDSFTVQMALENILDQHYKTFASGLSAPGRNFIVTLRARF
mgnify:CR=1 FL=1